MCQSVGAPANSRLCLLSRHAAAPRRQALSDFCSDPNTFILNTTQFNMGTSSGTAPVEAAVGHMWRSEPSARPPPS